MNRLSGLPLLIATQAALAGDVDFVDIPDGADCQGVQQASAAAVCRVLQGEDPQLVADLVKTGRDLTRSGDTLLFVHRGDADSVSLGGGLQFPLSRLRGTDLWALRLRVQDVDSLIMSYQFLVDGARPSVSSAIDWRGPAAPRPWGESEELQGSVSEFPIASRHLGESRTVTVYEPPRQAGDEPGALVYSADGQNLRALAPMLDSLIASGQLPPVLLVGIHAAQGTRRGEEYVPALGAESGAFSAHERFLLDEVLPFVEYRYSLPTTNPTRMLLGFSNGADWALATGLRNPSAAQCVVAFSPSWPIPMDKLHVAAEAGIAVALGSGLIEGAFHQATLETAKALEESSVLHQHQHLVAGHDLALWKQLLPPALNWCLAAKGA